MIVKRSTSYLQCSKYFNTFIAFLKKLNPDYIKIINESNTKAYFYSQGRRLLWIITRNSDFVNTQSPLLFV
jgi:hypothetical protein